MPVSKFAFAALAASLLSAPLLVAPALAAGTPPPVNAMSNTGGHGMMRGMFTDNEMMMMMVDGHKATASMTDDQKHAYRQDRRARILAMSESDRAKFKADLDTRWAALPADQKTMVEQAFQARMAAHQNGGGSQ